MIDIFVIKSSELLRNIETSSWKKRYDEEIKSCVGQISSSTDRSGRITAGVVDVALKYKLLCQLFCLQKALLSAEGTCWSQ
jgi:hypothetical protein